MDMIEKAGALEVEVKRLIQTFTAETGAIVHGFYVERTDTTTFGEDAEGESSGLYHVNVDARVNGKRAR